MVHSAFILWEYNHFILVCISFSITYMRILWKNLFAAGCTQCQLFKLKAANRKQFMCSQRKILISVPLWLSFFHTLDTYKFHKNVAHLCISMVNTFRELYIYWWRNERETTRVQKRTSEIMRRQTREKLIIKKHFPNLLRGINTCAHESRTCKGTWWSLMSSELACMFPTSSERVSAECKEKITQKNASKIPFSMISRELILLCCPSCTQDLKSYDDEFISRVWCRSRSPIYLQHFNIIILSEICSKKLTRDLGSPYTKMGHFHQKKSKIFYFFDLSQKCPFPPYTKMGH